MEKIKSLNDIHSVRAYLARVNAEPRSLRKAVVKERHGNYDRDIAVITFNLDGTVTCTSATYAPTAEETILIEREIIRVNWPVIKPILQVENLPPEVKAEIARNKENYFEFRDVSNMVVMVQVRFNLKDGVKKYVPYTYWDDDIWRSVEPDDFLPIWGIENLGDNTTVFIHEGAKAARRMHNMVTKKTAKDIEDFNNHPWALELSEACHLGWIGGAMAPLRTDWGILKRRGVQRVYIVSDNDEPGIAAVPKISKQVNLLAFHLQFTNEWPASFDLGDDFPKTMFKDSGGGKKRYIGPSLIDCLHPGTWATDEVPGEVVDGQRRRPYYVLRDCFKRSWSYVEDADVFVCVDLPDLVRSEAVLNKMLAAFSHVKDTCNLIIKAYHGRTAKLCYRPDTTDRIVTDKTTSAINLYVEPNIKPERGDPQPFIDFITYLFPIAHERHEVFRWLATLIARPDIRMHYGILLVTECQGIGKGTLCSAILQPLMGVNNVSWPNERDIVDSDFNDWIAHKRLIVVNEVYSGHSWKAYNNLKTVITDTEVSVNQKFRQRYILENWAHVIACSNSRRALKIEADDRRWFYPTMSEVAWSTAQFAALRNWILSGGLGIIKQWALDFKGYVVTGDRSPMTEKKKEIIEESRSEAQQEAIAFSRAIIASENPIAIAMKSMMNLLRLQVDGRVYDSEHEIKQTMSDAGVKVWPKRITIAGRSQYIIMNKTLYDKCNPLEDAEASKLIRFFIKEPSQIIEELRDDE